jgi:hypothetical protein
VKKIAVLLLVVFMATIGSACAKQSDKITLINGNPDPPPISEEIGNLHEAIGIEADTSYDNIVATTENAHYALGTEEIICVVRNNNVGKGFYVYDVPFLEMSCDGEWVRLSYQPPQIEVAQWSFCGIENNATEPTSRNLTFSPQYVENALAYGNYRLVVFTAQKTLYVPFVLVIVVKYLDFKWSTN